MAAVGGIPRLFQPTIGILSGEKSCQGINPWYFLIGLRMVTLYFALGPCESLRQDLICQWPSDVGDAKAFCSALCYNQHFPIPIASIWAFHFVTIIFTVALMKCVHVVKKDASAKDVEAVAEPKPAHGTEECCDPGGPITFGGWRYGIYIFCIVLILTIDLSFIWILLGLQLPIMNQAVVICHPNNAACPLSAQCVLNVQSDKKTVFWALAFCAAINASVCLAYLAAHGGQACGHCGGCGRTGKARTGCHGNCAREAMRPSCACDKEGCRRCQDGSGGWTGPRGHWGDGSVGTAPCRCQAEGLNCCCRRDNNSGRDVACGCQDSKQCPCYFQGSEAGHSWSLQPSRDNSEGKLLRGDTELGGERKGWRLDDGSIPMGEPLRTGAKKSQGYPGREGRVVKYGAKYQVRGKQRV